jgi:prevent-host-death family protein
VETIGAYAARTHLSRLLDEVAAGRSFVITKRGLPVARLVAVRQRAADPADVIAALRAARKEVRRCDGDTTIREMIEDGRR